MKAAAGKVRVLTTKAVLIIEASKCMRRQRKNAKPSGQLGVQETL